MEKVDVWPLLTAEMQAAHQKNEALSEPPSDAPRGHPLPEMRRAYDAANRYWTADKPPVGKVLDFSADSGAGSLALRLYLPDGADSPPPLLIYLHGGGFVVGNLDTHDGIMRRLCRGSGWAVLGIDYALAPETRFPVQIKQIAGVVARLDTILAEQPCRWDCYAIAGDSAGGHLAVSACLELTARALPLPKGLFSFYATFGLTGTRSQALYGGPLDGLSEAERTFFRDAYIRPADREDPRYALLTANLSCLPPTYLMTLKLDPLDDDSTAMAEALEKLGRPYALRRWDGLLHGCLKYARALPPAETILAEAATGLQALADGRFEAWLSALGQEQAA
ncbi:MAG: alpha/beta hydrolase fold domain-containing protein [Pseudomonadota bacterium]